MPAPTINQVRETYRKYFKALKESTDAWNNTLNELAPLYSRDMSEEDLKIRHAVGDMLRKIQDEVDFEEGDPFSLAHHAALEALRKDDVAEIARNKGKERIDEMKAEFIRENQGRKGPKEWSPKKRTPSEEEVEEHVQEELESGGGGDLSLFIMFDDKGGLEGWQIEHPDYWRGHGGPVAQVFISDSTDYNEISNAISEAFESIDWDEVRKELESEEEADEE